VEPEGIEHFHVQAGEVRLHCAALGPRDGALVLLLHGFPECWITWRRQLPALAAAGLRAVAPDLRGYGGSDKPRGVPAYGLGKLAQDVADLVRALGRERADVVGHDWGGAVAWGAGMWHPERVRKLAILNSPHPHRMSEGLRRPRQFLKSWYFLFFQLPLLPELALSPARLRALFRKASAHGAYDEADIAANLEAMKDPEGPLNYYRAAARIRSPRWQPVAAETLVIWGERDPVLGSELAEPDPKWVPRARVERVASAAHWVQADDPDAVNRSLVQFLR